MGKRYTSTNGIGAFATGYVSPVPTKPPSLLDSSGKIFEQSKPLYEFLSYNDFVVATDNGISNEGKIDQHAAINTLLANNVGLPIYFPAGIYLVTGTVVVPVGSYIIGVSRSVLLISSDPEPSYFALAPELV